jgi:acyl-CoA synthetase (AMP-forming)/AMP-acid ligase II
MPTIAGTLRATARRVPDAEALQFGERTLSYRELDKEVDRYAAVLRDSGVLKGDRVGLMSGNSDTFVFAFYAVQRLGAILVPVNPASAPPEVDHLISDAGVKVLLVAPALVERVPAGCPADVLSLGPAEGCADLVAAAASTEPLDGDTDVAESDDALILYTSGTTGKPKGALFDHHRSMVVAMSLIPSLGMRAGDRFLHVAPLYHAAELAIMLVPGTMIGAKHVVLSEFNPVTVLDVMERERITMFFGVPTMFQLMMRTPGAGDRDLSAWRTGLFGAAPMPAPAVSQMVDTWPQVEFMQLCGQTEAGPSGIYSTHEQVIERPDASGRQGVVFTEARVVDERFEDVAPGGTGELLLRSETVMKGYWRNPEATAAAFHGPWLRTGDIVRLDPDGYLTLVDRLKDMIITGGRNVYSIEVENAITAHPAVVDAAVVAHPHPDFGESIVAVVALADGATLTLEELREHCRPLIADYKLPHDLVIAAIPRNASGKILKHRLRAEVVAPA